MKWSNAFFIASALCLFKAIVGKESMDVNFWLLVASVVTFFIACIIKGWKVEGQDDGVIKILVAYKLVFGGWAMGIIGFLFAVVMIVTH